MNEPSDHAPTVVAMPGKNHVMALLRRSTDGLIRYTTWKSPGGFSGQWGQIGSAITTPSTFAAVATDMAIHVSYRGTDSKYYYAQSTDGLGFVIKNEKINTSPPDMANDAFGPAPTAMAVVAMAPTVVYAGNNSGLYSHAQTMASTVWPATEHVAMGNGVVGIPAIIALDPASNREGLIVFTDSLPVSNQLYWIAKPTNGAWNNSPAAIFTSASDEPVLLALPNGDAILTYRDVNKKVWWTRFTGIDAKWSMPQQPLGNMAAKSKPALALGAGDAEVELLFVDDVSNNGYHARLHKGVSNFTMPAAINGATNLVGIAAATNL